MKSYLRWAARIFVLLLCVSSFFSVCIPTAKAENQTRYGYTKLENDQQRSIYENLVTVVSKGVTSVSFSHSWNLEDPQVIQLIQRDSQRARDMFKADYPEFFWFSDIGEIKITGPTVALESISYIIDGQTVSGTDAAFVSAKAALDREVNAAIAGMPNGSDYEKALYLHNYVAQKVDYVMTGDHQTAYGALVSGKAVCAGYARAYQLLLNKAGIDAWYVTGDGMNPATGQKEGHGWNVVFLDGKSFYTDVTWDDQPKHMFHAYFMLSRDEMGQTHFPDDASLLPDGNNVGKDYFTVKSGNGSGVGVFNGNATVAQVKSWMFHDSSDSWICEVKDTSHSFIGWLKNNSSALADALGLKGKPKCTTHVLGDEVLFHIESEGHKFPLKKHDAVPADCKNGGTSAYYECETCNKWFWDAEGKQPITDRNSVKTPVADHQYTVWKNNDSQHWKVCKVCSAEMPNSRTAHKDTNANKRCDVCDSVMRDQTVTPTTRPTTSTTASTQATTAATRPTTTPTTASTTPSTTASTTPSTTASTTAPTTASTTASTTAPVTNPSIPSNTTTVPSTVPSVPDVTNSSASESTQGSTSSNASVPAGSTFTQPSSEIIDSGNSSQGTDEGDGGNVVLVIIFALGGCGVTAGAAITFIRFRKR